VSCACAARAVHACMDAYTRHAPSAQPCCSTGTPGGSSLPCHCTARVPSTNAASSRAGVAGRVQSITKAFVVQVCIRLDLCTARTRLHAPSCCNGMIASVIASFIFESNPDARNGPRNVQAPCLHPPASPPGPRLGYTHRPSAACLHRCETRISAKMVLLCALFAPVQSAHRWSVVFPTVLASQLTSTQPNQQGFKWVSASA